MDLLLALGLPVVLLIFSALLLLIPAAIGRQREKKLLAELDQRELAIAGFPVVDTETMPTPTPVSRSWLVSGSVVVGAHRGQQFLSQLKNLVGGELISLTRVYETARRDAQLRMIEAARAQGATGVVNVRINHSDISHGKQVATEVFIVGTAIA
jgi:uncharacterized protein YbjQ (UPF0145 family)